MNNVLIDTDVILDFLFDRKPFSEFATQIFSLCESKQISGFATPVAFSNAYYILRQTAKHEKVIENLSLLASIIDVLLMDKNTVLQALHSQFTDFEDALQNYSATQHGKIEVILTRNVKDYKNSTLGVLTPENYLKEISNL